MNVEYEKERREEEAGNVKREAWMISNEDEEWIRLDGKTGDRWGQAGIPVHDDVEDIVICIESREQLEENLERGRSVNEGQS